MILRNEPLLKRFFLGFTLMSIFIVMIMEISNYYLIKDIHKQQIEANQQLVGKLTAMYPEKEVDIVRAVLYEDDSSFKLSGEKILDKYSYNTRLGMLEEDRFKGYFYSFMLKNSISFIFIILINILFLYMCSSYLIKRIDEFSIAADKIMMEDYSLSLKAASEGCLSRVGAQFMQMADRLRISMKDLRKEKEEIKSLVSDISHQLKTPVASIKVFNSLLLEEELEPEEQREFLVSSSEEINKLEWLVKSLINISRLEIGMIELKKEKGNIKKTILDAVKSIYLKAAEKDINIEVNSIDDCYLFYDSKWTKEAIFNVVENAVKYTSVNGNIKVYMTVQECFTRIDIEDNGIGIPKEEYNNIFKRFYRGKSPEIKQCEGSGIGLYLTRRIVEQQGGSVVVNSIEGQGSTFSIYLQNCK